MHAEKWGQTSWSRFPSPRIKKQKPLRAANVPAILLQVHYLLFHLSYGCTCLTTINIGKVRQQYKQPRCCLTSSPFRARALLRDLSCCLRTPFSRLQSGWSGRGRQGAAVQPRKFPSRMNASSVTTQRLKGCGTQSSAEFSNASFSLAIAWAAEIQCRFTAESNLILDALLWLPLEAV